MVRFTRDGHARRYAIQKESVLRFFADPAKWDQLYENPFSRRFLDHLVTEFARAHTCQYTLTDVDTGEQRLFNIYHSAQSILCGVHKRHLDPFKRYNKHVIGGGDFEFGHGDKKMVVNVPVLTFFRWAIRNRVLDFAREHEDEIRADMAAVAQAKRARRAVGEKRPFEGQMTEPVLEVTRLDYDSDQETTDECKQRPRKRRKRFRPNRVNAVSNKNVTVKAVFS